MLSIAVNQLKMLTDSVAVKSFFTLLSKLLLWFDEMESMSEGGENVWDGEEAMMIFHERFGLNEESLNVYRQHLMDLLEQQDDFDGIFDMEEINNEGDDDVADSEKEKKIMLSTASLSIIKSLVNVFLYMIPNCKD